MPKNKKVIQVHGKEEDKYEITSLEQIWGNTGINKYGTFEEEEYLKEINSLNKSDLQTHAIKIGLIPTENRQRLVESLLREFKKHVASFRKPKIKQNNTKIPSKKILDILAEGR